MRVRNTAWLAGLLAAFFLFTLVLTPVLWNGSWPVDTVILAVAALVAIVFLWARQRSGLPRTGLEWPVAGLLITTGLAVAFSPDPRMGLERAALLVTYALLYDLLVDAFDSGLLPPRAPLYAGVAVALFTAVMAVLETYVWYQGYWNTTGFGAQPPYAYRLVGLLGHPNFYMALVNLCAPLALITFLRSKRFQLRFGAALYLAFYAISVPFSSSRSGWVGMAIWVGVLFGLWLLDHRRWAGIFQWMRRRLMVTITAGAAAVLAGAYVLYRFLLAFGAHPTHGGNIFSDSGRSFFWAMAIQIWQSAWLTGAGPSRFAYEYLRVTSGFPPGFWAMHAHNFPLTWLAENGLLGILALIALILVVGRQLWVWYAACAPENRPVAGALMAGLSSFAMQSVFDDFTGIVLLMVLVTGFTAWLAAAGAAGTNQSVIRTAQPGTAVFPGNRIKRWRAALGWLAIPLAGVLGVFVWTASNEYPFWQARQAAEQGDWTAAADLAEQSAARDPDFVFYQVEAGLARARAWRDSQNPADLQAARRLLARAVQLEPAYSLQWANLGVLDRLSGDLASAETHLLEAVRRAPGEPSYWLNLGAVREAAGNAAGAQEAYRHVLELAPGWGAHPFWMQTELRRAFSQALYPESTAVWLEAQARSEWQAALAAVDAGKFAEAREKLALSQAAGEDEFAYLSCAGRLAEAEGNLAEARGHYQVIEDRLAGDYLADYSSLSAIYARLHRRTGLDIQVVPGYLALGNMVGQLDALEAYYNLQVREDGCAAAAPTWITWQRAVRGGALDLLPSPDCR